MGELIGYKKLKDTVDYKKFEFKIDHKYPQEWLTYLKRDCEILAKFLVKFFTEKPKACSLKKQTIGSIAYSYIKGTIKEMIPNFTVKDYYKWEYWYHGGLCFPSDKYGGKWAVAKQRIKMIDACSMYPSQMIKPLPYGKASKLKPKGTSCCFMKIHIKHAVIKAKYSDIGVIWKPFDTNEKHQRIKLMTYTDVLYQYLQ